MSDFAATGSEAKATIDARPLIPATDRSPWAKAEQARDQFCYAIEEVLRARGMRALVSKSQPGVYPVATTLISWAPAAGGTTDSSVTRRETLNIQIEVNPYLEHPLIYHVAVQTQKKSFSVVRWKMTEGDAARLAQFALGFGTKPSILDGDAWRHFLGGIGFSFLLERNSIIEQAKPNFWTLPTMLVLASALPAFAAYSIFTYEGDFSPLVFGLIAGVVLLLWIATFLSARRPRLYSSVKRPEIAPRNLFLVDSWHTSIPDVGANFGELVSRIEAALVALDESMLARWERHQYRTPYTFEERDRLTLTKGQAVVHVHIYPFANDVFLGWDGFLNWASWAETGAVSLAVRNGARVEFRSLNVASYVPNEFDLVEFNALSELVHRRVILVLKAFLKEKQIEADIDFSIIRGSRDTALDSTRQTDRDRQAKKTIDV